MWLNPTGHKTIDFIINVNFSYSGRLMLSIFESASSRAVKEVCYLSSLWLLLIVFLSCTYIKHAE